MSLFILPFVRDSNIPAAQPVPFDPARNLEEVVSSFFEPVSADLLAAAEAAAIRNQATLDGDIDEWVERLADDLSKLTD